MPFITSHPLQENSIILNGSVMVSPSRMPEVAGNGYFDETLERHKLFGGWNK